MSNCYMTRKEFSAFMREQFEEIFTLYEGKNDSYGQDDRVFFNFDSSALRVFGKEGPEERFRVLLTYMDKHLVALANKGTKEPEYKDRLKDIIVYAFLAMAMEWENRYLRDSQITKSI